MKVTNKFGLPDAIVRAVQNDPYSKGDTDYSVTDLLQPPRKLLLTKEHFHEIEEDATDRIWSLFGQAVHHISERANVEDVVEKRYFWEVLGKKISGQIDNYNTKTKTITDYKVTTVAKISFKDFKDWEEQQNCYAQLMRWHGEFVKKLEILAITRDHRPRESETARNLGKPYPEKSQIIEIPMWDENKATTFLRDKVFLHENAKRRIPECTPLERWATPDVWAVKKTGQKNAVAGHSNYASKESAERAVNVLGSGHYLEHRPGRNRRCEDYCGAAPWCEQFKKLKV